MTVTCRHGGEYSRLACFYPVRCLLSAFRGESPCKGRVGRVKDLGGGGAVEAGARPAVDDPGRHCQGFSQGHAVLFMEYLCREFDLPLCVFDGAVVARVVWR